MIGLVGRATVYLRSLKEKIFFLSIKLDVQAFIVVLPGAVDRYILKPKDQGVVPSP